MVGGSSLPVSRGVAVIKRVACVTAAVPIGHRRGDGGGRIGGEFWGGGEIPGWSSTRSTKHQDT